MSTKQEIVSDAAFKAWPFSSDFNFACKDGCVIWPCKIVCMLKFVYILCTQKIFGVHEKTYALIIFQLKLFPS